MQLPLFNFETDTQIQPQPFKTQLLKWIGNKQRFAHEIIGYFPRSYGTYYEPFLGSGAVLGSLAPRTAIASDTLKPLVEIWQTLREQPEIVKQWYQTRWDNFMLGDRVEKYEEIKSAYNFYPNGADLLFLSRSCYGGVVRFRRDGYMSTPIGIHQPIEPRSFNTRVGLWHERTNGTQFIHSDFEMMMEKAQPGDLIYCDPPYSHTQAILYGAQDFSLKRLFGAIARCKERSVYVALSIDGSKKNGQQELSLPIPDELFEHEALVNCGRSMLKRFQMEGQSLENEIVADRLLLTY